MFDNGLPGPEALAAADDTALVAAIAGWDRVESAAAARRLAAIGELVARRNRAHSERSRWACDNWDSAAAEVAAAANISHGLASRQMYLAVALRDRLPQVAALFTEGAISLRLFSAIAWHTTLIDDPDTLGRVDGELADAATTLGGLTSTKAADAIDALIERHDPAALRRNRTMARSRDVVIGSEHHESGTSSLWGRLFATDARRLDQRLDQLARAVCAEDPRTLAQRRADALGVLAAGGDTLACGCGRPDCPAATGDARAAATVVYVVADAAALQAQPDKHCSGPDPAPASHSGTALIRPPAPEPDPPQVHAPAALVGGGILPASLVAELVAGGATVKPLAYPTDLAAKPGYRPSAALAAFVRARDLTCRWPGCDRPAVYCEIDHAVPYPFGPTHPANLRCLCKAHHLLKTFWTGRGGWSDRQLPDGTIIFTAPTGHTYTTYPGSRLLFPALCLPGSQPPPASTDTRPAEHRGLKVPLRRRTRAQDRAQHIQAERNKPPPP